MSEEEIEYHAKELQQATPPPGNLGTIAPWEILQEAGKEYWRVKVRNGERAPPAAADA